MEPLRYEYHVHKDPDFPIIFHYDTQSRKAPTGIPHWHEALELLYFVEGRGRVFVDTVPAEAGPGELAVINSGSFHDIKAAGEFCAYYCLIADKAFCDGLGIYISDLTFRRLVSSPEASGLFGRIAGEMSRAAPYYKTEVKSLLGQLLVYLAREQSISPGSRALEEGGGTSSKKLGIVKEAVSYLRLHYREPVSIEDVCAHIGFSKSYFCHVFREIAGRTVTEYLNGLRCRCAQNLLDSGMNVTESALLSGFQSASYFTKIYKRQMGTLPSQSGKRLQAPAPPPDSLP